VTIAEAATPGAGRLMVPTVCRYHASGRQILQHIFRADLLGDVLRTLAIAHRPNRHDSQRF
jgi:hypothetical protein